MKNRITSPQLVRILLIGIFAFIMAGKSSYAANTIVISSASQVGTAFLSANGTNVIVSQFTIVTGSSGSYTLSAIAEGVTGNYTSSDITSAKLYCSTTATTFASASQIGSTITPAGAPETFTFSGLTQAVTSSKTATYFIVVTLASGATSGHTLTMSAIAVGGFTFSAQSLTPATGSVTASGVETIQATQSVISSPSQVGTSNAYTGTGNNVISEFQIAEGQGSPTGVLSSIAAVTGGTYASSDITSFQLYASATNSIVGANPLGAAQSSVSGHGETITFSSLALTIAPGTEYFFITTTVSGNANTSSNTISANAITTGVSGINFSTGTNSGSVTAGGTVTISNPVAFAPAVAYTVETFETANGSTNGVNQALPDGWTISGAQAVNWGASTQHVSTAYSPNLLFGGFSGNANLGDGATGTPVLGSAAVIVTPDFNTTGLDPTQPVKLDFGYYYSAQYNATIQIDYSINGGTSWTSLIAATNAGATGSAVPGTNPFNAAGATWVAYSGQPSAVTNLPGSTCAGITNLRIRFTITRTTTSGNFHIDDVTIGGTSLNATIVASPASLSLYTELGGTPQYEVGTYTLSGTNLSTNPIIVTPPVGVDISQDGISWIDNPSSYSYNPASGTVTSQTVYVRISSTNSVGAFASANITNTCTTTGSNNPNVAVNGTVFAAPVAFTPGNIVGERIFGAASTTNTSLTVLDEINPGTQTVVQTIPMPFTSTYPFSIGSSSSEGLNSLSVDGQYIISAGYSSAFGTTSDGSPATTPRIFTRVKYDGTIDTTTCIHDATASAGNVRTAASVDGSGFWLSDNDASNNTNIYQTYGQKENETFFQGTSLTNIGTTPLTNTRGIGIFDGSLYVSQGSTIYEVPGTPTTPVANATALTGIPSGGEGTKSLGFILFDVDPSNPGPDVAYVADLGSNFTANTAYSTNTAGTFGLFKYVYSGGTWVNKGKIVGPASAVTGAVVGNNIVLYVVVNNTSTTDTIYTITDLGAGNSGTYTNTITNNGESFNEVDPTGSGNYIASATGTNYKGVTFAPVQVGAAPTTTATSGASVGNPLVVASSSTNNVVYQFSLTNNSSTTPAYFTGLTLTPSGTNTAADFTAYNLYYSTTSSTFSTTTAFKVGTATPTGSGTPFTFNLGLALPASSTGYFFFTANIAVSPTGGDDLTITTPTDANFTFADGGSETSGNFTAAIGDLLINPVPTVAATVSSVSGLYAAQSQSGASQNFNVSGLYLTGNETAQFTTGTNFEFSKDNSTWVSGASQLSWTPVSQTVAATPLYVRIKSSASTGSISDVITLTTSGGNTVTINVSGYVGKPFTAGNILISRTGTGAAVLSSAATPIFLDEYTTTDTLVQSIPLPTVESGSSHICTSSGTAGTVGLDHLSLDGQYYLSTGFDGVVGTTKITSTHNSTFSSRPGGVANRVVASIKYDATVNTTTSLTDAYDSALIRSATSIDGTSFYVSGSSNDTYAGADGGVRWVNNGASTSTSLSTSSDVETRNINIIASQLYASTSTNPNKGINEIGTGVNNTSGQSITNLISSLTSGGITPYGFAAFASDTTQPGVDIIYIADQTNGVYKYAQDATGTWNSYGQLTGAANGITGKLVGTNYVLYVVSGARGTSGNTVYSFTDPVGHNTITGAGSAITTVGTLVATAATNTTFSSVDFVPVALGGTPSVAVTSPGPAAGGILPGSSHDVIYELNMVGSTAKAIVTTVTLPLLGSYTSNDLTANAFELWSSANSAFDTTALRIGQGAFVSSGGNVVFNIAQQISVGSTEHFFFTVNAKSGATVGHNIWVPSFTASANIILADAGTVTGTPVIGGVQTIDACLNSGGSAWAGGGTQANPNTVICNGTAASIGLHNALFTTINWQYSADGETNWQEVVGGSGDGTTTYITAALTTTTYFRALVTNPCFVVASNTVIVSVLPATPALTVTLTNQTSTSIVANWTPNAANSNVQFNITWTGTGGGSASGVNSPYVIASGITAGDPYTVTVNEVKPAGCPATGTATINALCAAPTLSLSSPANKGFTATWNNTGATTYRLYFKQSTYPNYSFVDVSGTTYTFTSLYPDAEYLCYVAAENCPVPGQFGVPSVEQYINTLPGSSPCAVPVVGATSSCANQITITLSGSPTNNYFVIFGRISPNPSASVGYSITGTAGTTTVNINVGIQNAASTWQVYAESNCGGGLLTLPCTPVYVTIKPTCNQLQNLVLSTPNCDGFVGTWNADNCSGSLVSYYLYVKKSTAVGYNAYPVGTNNYIYATWLGPNTYNAYVASASCNKAIAQASTVQTIVTGVGCGRAEEAAADNNPTTTEDNNQKVAMNIYPNPTNGNFMVNVYTKGSSDENIKIEIFNTLGQVVLTLITPVTNGISNNAFEMPEGFASGIYFIHTVVNGENLSQQVFYTR